MTEMTHEKERGGKTFDLGSSEKSVRLFLALTSSIGRKDQKYL